MSKPLDYGIDAPGLVRTFFMLGSGALVVALVLGLGPWSAATWKLLAGAALLVMSGYCLGMGVFMVYGSKVGKIRRRERLLDLVPWIGTESVLDVGCGRGLMLVGAAKRLTTGKATGIDVWKGEDQSGNTPEAAKANALAEHVAERVEVRTSDMRTMGFDDGTFDVVVSHWAVHNLNEPEDRKAALTEIARVLRPRGYLLLADIAHHEEYAAALRELGLKEVNVIENGPATRFAAAISFGSYRPATVYARK